MQVEVANSMSIPFQSVKCPPGEKVVTTLPGFNSDFFVVTTGTSGMLRYKQSYFRVLHVPVDAQKNVQPTMQIFKAKVDKEVEQAIISTDRSRFLFTSSNGGIQCWDLKTKNVQCNTFELKAVGADIQMKFFKMASKEQEDSLALLEEKQKGLNNLENKLSEEIQTKLQEIIKVKITSKDLEDFLVFQKEKKEEFLRILGVEIPEEVQKKFHDVIIEKVKSNGLQDFSVFQKEKQGEFLKFLEANLTEKVQKKFHDVIKEFGLVVLDNLNRFMVRDYATNYSNISKFNTVNKGIQCIDIDSRTGLVALGQQNKVVLLDIKHLNMHEGLEKSVIYSLELGLDITKHVTAVAFTRCFKKSADKNSNSNDQVDISEKEEFLRLFVGTSIGKIFYVDLKVTDSQDSDPSPENSLLMVEVEESKEFNLGSKLNSYTLTSYMFDFKITQILPHDQHLFVAHKINKLRFDLPPMGCVSIIDSQKWKYVNTLPAHGKDEEVSDLKYHGGQLIVTYHKHAVSTYQIPTASSNN